MLFGDVAQAAGTDSAGRFAPEAGITSAGVHGLPVSPRHHAGPRAFLSGAKTSTRPDPDEMAHTPVAGMDTGPTAIGTGALQVPSVSVQRHTVLPEPVANTSTWLESHDAALGGPASPPGRLKVLMTAARRWDSTCRLAVASRERS